jgi:hypothetical protein
MADAFLEPKQQDMAKELSHAEWFALLIDRKLPNRNTKRPQIRCARRACATAGPASRTSITKPSASSTGLFQQLSHQPMDR